MSNKLANTIVLLLFFLPKKKVIKIPFVNSVVVALPLRGKTHLKLNNYEREREKRRIRKLAHSRC